MLKEFMKLPLVGASAEAVGAVWRVLITLLLLVHIAFACGWLAAFGLPGFALAADFRALGDDVRTVQADVIDAQIFETRMRHCEATGDTRTALLQRLNRLLLRYQELTGRPYPLPRCEDL